ncbi:MAG: toxin-antitoxin system YwqK family antitoxin [Bacteroidota bacterium]
MRYFFLLLILTGCAREMSAQYPKPGADTTYKTRSAPEADCGWDLEYDERKDIIFHKKSQMPYTGVCRTYYEDGRLEREAHFVEGKEEGVSKTYYQRFEYKRNDATGKCDRYMDKSKDNKPGKLWTITEFKGGLPHGTWKYYYEPKPCSENDAPNQLAWENYYVDGKKDGTWIFYFDDGMIKKEESYKEDKKDGTFKEYFKGTTQLKSEINYKADYLDGVYKMFYEDGKPFIEANYKQGKEEGEQLTYHKNGNIASIKKYKNTKPEGTWRTYYDDGKDKSVAAYVNGKKNGEHKEFYREGQLKKKAVYKEDKLVSVEEYDEFGNKLDPAEKTNNKKEEED